MSLFVFIIIFVFFPQFTIKKTKKHRVTVAWFAKYKKTVSHYAVHFDIRFENFHLLHEVQKSECTVEQARKGTASVRVNYCKDFCCFCY